MENKPKKGWISRHPVATVIIAIIVVSFGLAANGGASDQNSYADTPAAVQNSTPPPSTPEDIVCGMTAVQLKQKAQVVSYGQLEKEPDSFQGTFTKFTGQILEIQQEGSDGVMRLSVTDEGGGFWSPNDVVFVEYHRSTPAVQGDVVTVYGMLNGSYTYTSEANYQITLPDMVACTVGPVSGQ